MWKSGFVLVVFMSSFAHADLQYNCEVRLGDGPDITEIEDVSGSRKLKIRFADSLTRAFILVGDFEKTMKILPPFFGPYQWAIRAETIFKNLVLTEYLSGSRAYIQFEKNDVVSKKPKIYAEYGQGRKGYEYFCRKAETKSGALYLSNFILARVGLKIKRKSENPIDPYVEVEVAKLASLPDGKEDKAWQEFWPGAQMARSKELVAALERAKKEGFKVRLRAHDASDARNNQRLLSLEKNVAVYVVDFAVKPTLKEISLVAWDIARP